MENEAVGASGKGSITIGEKSAADLAKEYFIYGYHCSESVAKAINDYYKLNLDKSIIKMGSAFSAGMGKAKCACGTITAGSLILGYLYGRTEAHEDDDLLFDLVREYNEQFVAEFETPCCRELTKDVKWGHPDHRERCAEIVRVATQNLSEILEETQKNMPIENGVVLPS